MMGGRLLHRWHALLLIAAAIFLLAWSWPRATPTALPNGQVLVRYQLWDSQQLPAYRQCAADFMQANPDIHIRITQVGWGDYWTGLSTGFIAGAAPDVFVNHLQHAPQFMRHGVVEDLTEYVKRDALDLQDSPPALLNAWQDRGRLLGLPKDWDTVAILVNLDHAERQGVTLAALQEARWNPVDGGEFGQLIRQLTVDQEGRNALHPEFDRRRVVVYGYQPPGPGGLAGQTEWVAWAASNGHVPQAEPWGPLRFDEPRLAQAIQWLADLAPAGLAAPPMEVRSIGTGALFAAGRVALMPDGAWMATYFGRKAPFRSTWIRAPDGPMGFSASMLNGTADSMWAGSKVKPQAWRWMAYLASEACQRTIAKSGIVFPARLSLAELTVQAHRAQGVDSSAFVQAAKGRTVLTPILDDGARIDDIVKSALESVHLGKVSAEQALKNVDEQIVKRNP